MSGFASRFLGIALAALGAAVADGQPKNPGPRPADLVRVRAVTDASRVGPGQTFHLAVVFDIKPKWHLYWKNPGEGSAPPRVTVEAPAGFRVGAPLWTRPTAFETPFGAEYGYEDQVVLFVPIVAPQSLADGRVTLHAGVRWAACKERCVLGTARQSVIVRTSSGTPAPAGPLDPLLSKHKRRLPRPLDSLAGSTVEFQGGTLTITGPAQDRSVASFFPAPSPGVTCGKAEVAIEDDRFRVSVKVAVNPQNALGQRMVIGGLVALGEGSDEPCYDFELPLPSGPGPAGGEPKRSSKS